MQHCCHSVNFHNKQWKKVNTIIKYFSNATIELTHCECALEEVYVHDYCKKSEDDLKFKYQGLANLASNVLANITRENLKNSIETTKNVISRLELDPFYSTSLLLEIVHFVRGAMLVQANDPNEAIKHFCQCILILESYPGLTSSDVIYHEFLHLNYIFNYYVYHNSEISVDNFDLIKEAFFKILPKLGCPSQKKSILKNILLKGLIQQRKFSHAKKIILQISSEEVDVFDFGLWISLAYCLIEENHHSEANTILQETFGEMKSIKRRNWIQLDIHLLVKLGQYFLQLGALKMAMETVEFTFEVGQKVCSKTFRNSEQGSFCAITMILSGLKLNKDSLVNQYLKSFVHPKICYIHLQQEMRNLIFQSNVPIFLKLLQTKQNLSVQCSKCFKFKCRHFRNESRSKYQKTNNKSWRMFKNKALIGYFARKAFAPLSSDAQ